MPSPYRSVEPPTDDGPRELGQVVSVHTTSHRLMWIVSGILGLILTPVLTYQLGPLALLAMLAVTFGCVGASLLAAPRAIALLDDGLEERRWLGASRTLHFDDCRAVYRDFGVVTTSFVTRVTGCTWTLEDQQGRRFNVPHSLSNPDPLFERLIQRCERPVMGDAIEAFDEGELLRFGPLSLTNRYLESAKGTIVDINELEKVEASPRRLFIHVRNKLVPMSFALPRVPFPFVLFVLLARGGVDVRGIEGFVTLHK